MMPLGDRVSRWNASRWFAYLRSANVSRGADRAFRRWLTRDPRNEEEFERQELIWEMLGELGEDPDVVRLTRAATAQRAKDQARLRAWPRTTLAAALSLSALVAGVWYLTHALPGSAPPSIERVYSTGTGEQKLISLTDGSRVELNTATRLREQFTRQTRQLVLERGEALFFAKHDARSPFVVVAGRTTTRDIGTAFDILYLGNHTSISVLKGRVQVNAIFGPVARREVLLNPGESTDYIPGEGLGVVTSADLARIAFWQAHRIEFNNSTLSEAVNDFNRYVTMKIVIADPAIGQIRVSGVFRFDGAPGFVRALHDTFGIESEIKNGTYVLYSPANARSVTH